MWESCGKFKNSCLVMIYWFYTCLFHSPSSSLLSQKFIAACTLIACFQRVLELCWYRKVYVWPASLVFTMLFCTSLGNWGWQFLTSWPVYISHTTIYYLWMYRNNHKVEELLIHLSAIVLKVLITCSLLGLKPNWL